ncbi:MAG: transcriptional regulator [Pseudomonadota bacterium]
MARAGLGWKNHELATAAQITGNTVSKFERGGGVHASTVEALQSALEAAGVQFIDDGERIGVTIKKPEQQ